MAPGALPNLIVIGAAKAGTSSLHYYLGLHPEIQMSSPKELAYFLDDENFDPEPFVAGAYEQWLLVEPCNWSKGVDWYRGFFSTRFPVRGETTVGYTFPWYRGVAERMAGVVPDAKLIYVVRDPVGRIVSHYRQYQLGGRESRPLEAALANRNGCYVSPTRYASALKPFLERFPRERIHLVRQDHLLDRRRETLQEVFRFLDVDEGFWSPDMETLRNRSGTKGRGFRLADRLRRSRLAAPLRRIPMRARVRLERAVASDPEHVERPETDQSLFRPILDDLEPELAELEALTGWDLGAWRSAERVR